MRCIVVDDEVLSRKATEQLISSVPELQLVGSFDNPKDALVFLISTKVDLVFLDIEMPQMTGIDFIAVMQIPKPQVILTTSHTEFALKAFESQVFDYLVKPIAFDRFYKSVSKILTQAEQVKDKTDSSLFFKHEGSIVRINRSEIQYIEAMGDYITICTAQQKYVIYSTMKAMELKVNDANFLRVHRSYLVKINCIDSIEDNTIAIGSKLIPIGKSYRDTVLKRLQII